MLPAESIKMFRNEVQMARQTDDRDGSPKGLPVYTGDATSTSGAEANTSLLWKVIEFGMESTVTLPSLRNNLLNL